MEEPSTELHFQLQDGRRWLPIYTQPLHERRLLNHLQKTGIPCYLPLLKHATYKNVRRQNRTYQYLKEVLRPMFSGYLFACLAQEEEENAWRSRSIVRIIKNEAFTQDKLIAELNLIRRFELAAQTQKVEVLPHLVPGKKVVITSGPWEGIYGIIERRKKPLRFIVNLDIMERAVATEIDISQIKLAAVE